MLYISDEWRKRQQWMRIAAAFAARRAKAGN
jgi:hypothetical protein